MRTERGEVWGMVRFLGPPLDSKTMVLVLKKRKTDGVSSLPPENGKRKCYVLFLRGCIREDFLPARFFNDCRGVVNSKNESNV